MNRRHLVILFLIDSLRIITALNSIIDTLEGSYFRVLVGELISMLLCTRESSLIISLMGVEVGEFGLLYIYYTYIR